MTVIRLPNNWDPRPYQRPAWDYLEGGGKRLIAIWHRRSGKDSLALNWSAVAAAQRPGVYWHMLPEAAQARKAIWTAVNPHTGQRLIDQAFPRELRETTQEHEMMIRLRNGSVWQVVGSDNYNSLVGTPPVGIVYSEWALASDRSWDYLRPILAENGGWAIFITTPRGRNHAYKMHHAAQTDPLWYADIRTVADTGVLSDAILEQELRELQALHGEQDGVSIYRQEYYCSWDAPLIGSYYGSLLERAEEEGRVGDYPVEGVVHTAWDLGYDDDTAIWFWQLVKGRIRLIDCWSGSGYEVADLANVIHSRGYNYGDHWLPHDAIPKTLAANGRSILQQLWSLGVRGKQCPNLSVQDGIQAARLMLPSCEINVPACADGLEAIRLYRREWDDDKKAFKDRPLHDWTSHYADALRYLALVWRHEMKEKPKPQMKMTNQYTIAELIKASEQSKPVRRI